MSSGGVVSVPTGEPAMVGTSADSRLAAHDRRAVYRPDVNLERECCRSVSGGAKQPEIQSAQQWLLLCSNNHAGLRVECGEPVRLDVRPPVPTLDPRRSAGISAPLTAYLRHQSSQRRPSPKRLSSPSSGHAKSMSATERRRSVLRRSATAWSCIGRSTRPAPVGLEEYDFSFIAEPDLSLVKRKARRDGRASLPQPAFDYAALCRVKPRPMSNRPSSTSMPGSGTDANIGPASSPTASSPRIFDIMLPTCSCVVGSAPAFSVALQELRQPGQTAALSATYEHLSAHAGPPFAASCKQSRRENGHGRRPGSDNLRTCATQRNLARRLPAPRHRNSPRG